MRVRVVLADDTYLGREGTRRVFQEGADIEIVATCGDFDFLRAAVAETLPDVGLTDIRMPPTTQTRTSSPPSSSRALTCRGPQRLRRGGVGHAASRGRIPRPCIPRSASRTQTSLTRAIRDAANSGSAVDSLIVE